MNKFLKITGKYYFINLPLIFVFIALRIFEYFIAARKFFFIENPAYFEFKGFYYDIWAWLIYSLIFIIPFIIIYLIKPAFAFFWQHLLNILFILTNVALIITFSERSSPYDHEFFIRSGGDTWSTALNLIAGNTLLVIPLFLFWLFYALLFYSFRKIEKKIQIKTIGISILGISFISLFFIAKSTPKSEKFGYSASYYLVINKLAYFVEDSYKYFSCHDNRVNLGKEDRQSINKNIFKVFTRENDFEYIDTGYPLLHTEQSKNVLGKFFNLTPEKPNIVIILVEGLSRTYSGEGATVGSFTPFIDSLSVQGLYWENCFSTTLGSFGILPSTLGSLPYGKKGFTNLGKYPAHLSLIKILKDNGYYSFYFSGTALSYDNFGSFMRQEGVDNVLMDFGKYAKMPSGPNGIGSIGYGDDALFSRSLEVINDVGKTPYIGVYFTLSTHNPFIFEQKPYFDKLFDKRIKLLSPSPKTKKTVFQAKNFLSSMLFADYCIRDFINAYKKRPEYNNTIFIITGDHANGSVPASNELYYYHTPLIIFSPMLRKPEKFSSINTHNNLPQTILALLKGNGNLPNYPETVHWIGDVLDTAKQFRNIHIMPLVSWNYTIRDMIKDDVFISGKLIFRILPDIKLEPIQNDTILKSMQEIIDSYKAINNYVCFEDRLYNYSPAIKNLPILIKKQENELSIGDKSHHFLYFKMPLKKSGKIKYKLSFEIAKDSSRMAGLPILVISIDDTKLKNLYWGSKDILSLSPPVDSGYTWIKCTDEDVFNLSNFQHSSEWHLQLYLYNLKKIDSKIRNVDLQLYYEN